MWGEFSRQQVRSRCCCVCVCQIRCREIQGSKASIEADEAADGTMNERKHGTLPGHAEGVDNGAVGATLATAPKVMCPHCRRPLLASVFHLHVGPCQQKMDERAARELHSKMNADPAAEAAMAAAGRAEAVVKAHGDKDGRVGGLQPGPIGTNGRLDIVAPGTAEYTEVEAAFRATVRNTIVAIWRVTNRQLRERCVSVRTCGARRPVMLYPGGTCAWPMVVRLPACISVWANTTLVSVRWHAFGQVRAHSASNRRGEQRRRGCRD